MAAALLGVAGFCGALAPWLLRRLPGALDGLAARRKGVAVAMFALGVFTVTMTTRIAIFMGDARHPELSLEPEIPFLVEHSCLTAYVQGARLASDDRVMSADPQGTHIQAPLRRVEESR